MHSSSRASGGTAGSAGCGEGPQSPGGTGLCPGCGGTDGNAAALTALCARNKEQQPEAAFAVQKGEGARKGNVTRQRWAACPVGLCPCHRARNGHSSSWLLPGSPCRDKRGGCGDPDVATGGFAVLRCWSAFQQAEWDVQLQNLRHQERKNPGNISR